MNSLNIVIDFNNIAMRALFTCHYDGETKIKNFDTQKECDVLARKIVTDICSVLRTFNPNRVIVVCDAKFPWRSELYKGLDISYKGNRKKDEEKNWTNIFATFDNLKTILSDKGFVVTDIENAEADDLAALWKWAINERQGDNMIYVSSDKDWSQLVGFNDSGKFCIGYNPVINNKGLRKMSVDAATNAWLKTTDDVDFFMNGYNAVKNKINEIIRNNNKISVEVIDPDGVALDKIMCGDDGDNVPAFYEYFKNGKRTRVTHTKAKMFFESLNIKTINDLKNVNSEISLKEALESAMKTTIDLDFNSRLLRQRRMVELNPDLFPKRIVDNFMKHMENVDGKGSVDCEKIKTETVLKDTQYLDKNYDNTRYNSIFSDIKDITKFNEYPNLF